MTDYYKEEVVSRCKVIKVLQKWCQYCITWNCICTSKILFHS